MITEKYTDPNSNVTKIRFRPLRKKKDPDQTQKNRIRAEYFFPLPLINYKNCSEV